MNGLDANKSAFKYLDKWVTEPDWSYLHASVCRGIAKSEWNKRFVSSGIHPDFAHLEITPYMRNLKENLDIPAITMFSQLTTTDERIKFTTAWGSVPHPFWVLFLRNNRRIERTGIFNKSIEADCEWTENSTHFTDLVEFIKTLPFQQIGRVILFMTEANNQTLPHFDAAERWERPHDDFIWFTTKPGTKKIFVYDEDSKQKYYPEEGKRFIWFNEMDYHGTDAVDHFSFSIRIDGKFLPEVKTELIQCT